MRFMQWCCWLFIGHETILRIDSTAPVRVWTECMRCGYQSQGWSYGDRYVGPKP